MKYLHPLDAGLSDLNQALSGLAFPPDGWRVIQEWGSGYALQDNTGLRVIIDCSTKGDDRYWVHLSLSRAKAIPSHLDMVRVKEAFLGNSRYAYSVFPPRQEYVNIHPNCLHLWALVDGDGRVLPEFSAVIEEIGKGI